MNPSLGSIVGWPPSGPGVTALIRPLRGPSGLDRTDRAGTGGARRGLRPRSRASPRCRARHPPPALADPGDGSATGPSARHRAGRRRPRRRSLSVPEPRAPRTASYDARPPTFVGVRIGCMAEHSLTVGHEHPSGAVAAAFEARIRAREERDLSPHAVRSYLRSGRVRSPTVDLAPRFSATGTGSSTARRSGGSSTRPRCSSLRPGTTTARASRTPSRSPRSRDGGTCAAA